MNANLNASSDTADREIVITRLVDAPREGGEQTLARLAQQVAELGAHAADAFVLTRVFDAPRELVFQLWTQAEHLARWWGPKGFTLGVSSLDLRPGGVFHYSMRSPAGHEMWGKFVYCEVSPPSRLVFINSFADAAGNVTRHPGSATWPLEVLSTLEFSEQDGKTTLTMRGVPHHATEVERRTFREGHKSMEGGFGGTFAQLREYLATLRG